MKRIHPAATRLKGVFSALGAIQKYISINRIAPHVLFGDSGRVRLARRPSRAGGSVCRSASAQVIFFIAKRAYGTVFCRVSAPHALTPDSEELPFPRPSSSRRDKAGSAMAFRRASCARPRESGAVLSIRSWLDCKTASDRIFSRPPALCLAEFASVPRCRQPAGFTCERGRFT